MDLQDCSRIIRNTSSKSMTVKSFFFYYPIVKLYSYIINLKNKENALIHRHFWIGNTLTRFKIQKIWKLCKLLTLFPRQPFTFIGITKVTSSCISFQKYFKTILYTRNGNFIYLHKYIIGVKLNFFYLSPFYFLIFRDIEK